VPDALYGDLYFHRFSLLSGASNLAAVRPALPGDVLQPAAPHKMRVLPLAKIRKGIDYRCKLYGLPIVVARNARQRVS
jgi:hypothetical protein